MAKVTKTYKIGNDSTPYTIKDSITFYSNGTETDYYFDGCFSEDYTFPSASFTTIYNLMMLVVSESEEAEELPKEISRPRLRYAGDKVYEFDGVGAIEPQLHILKNGILLMLSSCD